MHLETLSIDNFRNLASVSVSLSKELNVVYGDNAAGKSSFLEAITLLASGRSFRSNKQFTFPNFLSTGFTIFGLFSNADRLGVNYQKSSSTRTIKLNGKIVTSLSKVVNLYPVQTLSPESYHLVDSGPSERRKFIDWLLFHVEHKYQECWSNFNRVLKQRNALLKKIGMSCKASEFEHWDRALVEASILVDGYRNRIVERLNGLLVIMLENIGFEYAKDIKLNYYSGYTGEFEQRLAGSFERDRLSGTTQFGPHKADLKIKVNGNLVKDVLSRGQKKILINTMFLAQTRLLKELTQKDSLFVIDDFSSELDESNQLSLVRALCEQENVQIIMSCLQPDMINPLIKEYNSVKMFHVEHGVITPNTSHIEN